MQNVHYDALTRLQMKMQRVQNGFEGKTIPYIFAWFIYLLSFTVCSSTDWNVFPRNAIVFVAGVNKSLSNLSDIFRF